ncbi:MAG: glycosyltransferase family 4 protein [Candidatus Cloacimonetes bacterium]|nr:glycosyltransferase family 4 protein [Candidatus Cloacimonadota bacterium]
MAKIKILWINDKADFTGGCESYIYHTAAHLAERGYVNTMIYDVDGWTEPKFTKVFEAAFPRVLLARQIAEIDPDIIYVHRLTGKKAIQELLQTGKPVIRFFHDHKLFCLREHKYKTISLKTCTMPTGLRCYPCLGFIHRSEGILPFKFASLSKLQAEQRINKKLAGFVVASDYMKDHLIDHGFAADKIKVIPLYSWKEPENMPVTDGNYLLYAGQILRGKGIDKLIEAMSRLESNIPLLIAGSSRQMDEYQQLCRSAGLEDRITFLGHVEQAKLQELYRNCTCVIMPSRVPETFGLSGLEAMSWSKPVIATNVGGIGQWLKNEKNGFLVFPNDGKYLAFIIDELLSDRERAKNMGKQGYKMYKKNFTAVRHLDSLQQYFEQIIKGSKL